MVLQKVNLMWCELKHLFYLFRENPKGITFGSVYIK